MESRWWQAGCDVSAADRQPRIPAIEFERLRTAVNAGQHVDHVLSRRLAGGIPRPLERGEGAVE